MRYNIFKFGGASVNAADGVRNVVKILQRRTPDPLVVVVSAMGKTTNALEKVLKHYMDNDPLALIEAFREVEEFHMKILQELFPAGDNPVFGLVDSLFNQLRGYIRKGHLYTRERPGYDFEYDQVVSYGELISSSILYHYCIDQKINAVWIDARELISTDCSYREAKIDWERSSKQILECANSVFRGPHNSDAVIITQGFIGSDPDGNTTTLGREGSDFSAAILAWSLRAAEMTIWKDVPGVMNADPKWMPDAVRIDALSYREAVELAYYGASVIHPRTIRPLENGNIRLRVRSFFHPGEPGTVIENIREWKIPHPIFIRKQHQVLISLSPRDFSFIIEENLSEIFRILSNHRVRVNIMQNSAISFSFCVDDDERKIPRLLEFLGKDYETRYNSGLELYTIRHYDESSVNRLTAGRNLLMELRSRNTVQLVVK